MPCRRTRRAVCAVFACLSLLFLLQSSFPVQGDRAWWFPATCLAAASGVALLAAAQEGVTILNSILLSLVAISTLGWVRSCVRISRTVDSSWAATNRSVYDQVAFVRKPNVYLIHAESYHSPAAMSAIYAFDNRDFLNSLAALGFTVHPNHFANYGHTLASLSALFSMQHHYYRSSVGNMDGLGARDMLGGRVYCPVLRIFMDNGYRCQIIHPSDYSFAAGDELDFAYPRRSAFKVFEIYQVPLLNRIVAARSDDDATRTETASGRLADAERLDAILEQRVLSAARSTKPYFSFLEPLGAHHSNIRKTWIELADWTQQYPEVVRQANRRLLKLLNLIIQNDPKAIVIVYGDHGAYRYRGVWEGKGDLNKRLRERGVSGSTLAMDIFDSLLAIRTPDGDPSRFSGTSLVNVFRVLCWTLSDDDRILKTTAPNESYFRYDRKVYVCVREGAPLEVWEVLPNPGKSGPTKSSRHSSGTSSARTSRPAPP
jgi:hypothetical protein